MHDLNVFTSFEDSAPCCVLASNWNIAVYRLIVRPRKNWEGVRGVVRGEEGNVESKAIATKTPEP